MEEVEEAPSVPNSSCEPTKIALLVDYSSADATDVD